MALDVLGKINVLIVEDQELAQRVTMRVLEGLGVNAIAVAENGAAAVEMLKDSDSRIDLVICDINMPEMSGFEFVRQIRLGAVPEVKNIPILMLTGEDTDENVTKGKYHRIDGFIVKPPTADSLRGHMMRALGLAAG